MRQRGKWNKGGTKITGALGRQVVGTRTEPCATGRKRTQPAKPGRRNSRETSTEGRTKPNPPRPELTNQCNKTRENRGILKGNRNQGGNGRPLPIGKRNAMEKAVIRGAKTYTHTTHHDLIGDSAHTTGYKKRENGRSKKLIRVRKKKREISQAEHGTWSYLARPCLRRSDKANSPVKISEIMHKILWLKKPNGESRS